MKFFKVFLRKNKNLKCPKGLQLYEKELHRRCFPVNIPKVLGTVFLIEQLC